MTSKTHPWFGAHIWGFFHVHVPRWNFLNHIRFWSQLKLILLVFSSQQPRGYSFCSICFDSDVQLYLWDHLTHRKAHSKILLFINLEAIILLYLSEIWETSVSIGWLDTYGGWSNFFQKGLPPAPTFGSLLKHLWLMKSSILTHFCVVSDIEILLQNSCLDPHCLFLRVGSSGERCLSAVSITFGWNSVC